MNKEGRNFPFDEISTRKRKREIESRVQKLLELFERLALIKYADKPLITSLTYSDNSLSLEIDSDKSFLKLIYEIKDNEFSEKASEETIEPEYIEDNTIDAIIKLHYTEQDLKPIRGHEISKQSFQGTIDNLYLMRGDWYYLNPSQFSRIMPLANLLLSEEIILNKILETVFRNNK